MVKIDRNKTDHELTHKLGVSISLLDKVKATVDLEQQSLQEVNVWTWWALGRVAQECELYKSSDGSPAALARYQQELDKLDKWVSDIAEVLGKYGALIEKADAPA